MATTIILASFFLECALADFHKPKKLTFAYVHPESTPKTQWLIKIYTEALKRMNIKFIFQDIPAKRASWLSNSGKIDGELNRVAYYNKSYPNMIRVPEPNQQIKVTAFTASKVISKLSLTRLKNAPLRIGYIRGLVHLEKELPQKFPNAKFAPVRDTEHGIHMLAKERIDVFIANQEVTLNLLTQDKTKLFLSQWGEDFKIFENINFNYTQSYYAWLYKSHRELAKPLAQVLRKMKSEGLFDLYKEQTGYRNTY